MQIKSFNTVDHDAMAGYGGRIGYRYKTVVQVEFESKVFNKARTSKSIGGLVLDVANHLYRTYNFTQTYSPQVDTKARGKKGVTTVSFEYFHNSDDDAKRMGYTGYMLKHHKKYEGPEKQWELNPNNQTKE